MHFFTYKYCTYMRGNTVYKSTVYSQFWVGNKAYFQLWKKNFQGFYKAEQYFFLKLPPRPWLLQWPLSSCAKDDSFKQCQLATPIHGSLASLSSPWSTGTSGHQTLMRRLSNVHNTADRSYLLIYNPLYSQWNRDW